MKDCGDYFYIRDDIQVESLGGDKIATSFFYPIEKEVRREIIDFENSGKNILKIHNLIFFWNGISTNHLT